MTYSNTFIHLATRLQTAIDSCEPDTHRLLTAINECLANLDALGGNSKVLDFDNLNLELNALIAKHTAVAHGKTVATVKEASTQTDFRLGEEIHDICARMKKQKAEMIAMIDELSYQLCRHLPPRKTFDDIQNEFMIMRDYHCQLYDYVEFLKFEIIKHHVRPGKQRIDILVQERLDCKSKLDALKETLKKYHYYYQKDLRLKRLEEMIIEHESLDLKMKSLLDILSQVAYLQESKESISRWISKEREANSYMEELEIKLKCFTSQERLESLKEMDSIRKFEFALFGNYNPFQRELMAFVKKRNSMPFISELESIQEKKFQDYISMLWKNIE